MKEENYISRPKTKPSSSTKGKLNEWDNGYKEFVPAGTRESNRQMLKQMGDSSFYKNEGKKESSYSLHLNVNAEPRLPEGGQGRMLYDDNQHLQVWFDSQKGEVTIQARLECTNQIERLMLQLQGQMNVCLARHRSEIVSNSNNK